MYSTSIKILKLKSLLLHRAFYSVDEFMLFLSHVDCKSMRAVLLAILSVLTNVDIRSMYCIV